MKYICLKDFFLDDYFHPTRFKTGVIVEKEVDMTAVFSYKDDLLFMDYKEFCEHFMLLSAYREQRINSILEYEN